MIDWKKYLIGGGCLALLWIISQMYIAKQNVNLEKQNAKIIEWQSQNPKVLWKKEFIKTASSTVTIKAGADAVTKVNPDGSVEVKGTADVVGKSESKEEGTEKKDTIPVYTPLKKEDVWFIGGAVDTTGSFGACGSYKLFNEVLVTGAVMQEFPLKNFKGLLFVQVPVRIP